MITNRLLNALKYEGFAKISAETMRRDQEYTQGIDTVFGIAKSAAVRFLVDERELAEIRRGIVSLDLLERLER